MTLLFYCSFNGVVALYHIPYRSELRQDQFAKIKPMPRPIRAVVNSAAISFNIKRIRQLLGGVGQLMPVVKANAYGHGLERIYPSLESADALAILEIEGAEKLRTLGWIKPILLLEGCFDRSDLHKAIDLKCDWVVHEQSQLLALENIPNLKLVYKPRIFLKMNTGMNRLGFHRSTIQAAIRQLDQFTTQNSWPTPVLMTHFANADEPEPRQRHPTVEDQYNNLINIKPSHWLSSLGNSAGILNFPDLAGDIARPGIAIYGASPGPDTVVNYGLKPALKFESEIIAIQNIDEGDRVGYGSRWQAEKDGRIAVVACGYADGYPRYAPDGTPTFVEGRVAPVAGRVSMDMMTIDITHIPEAIVGSTVELWGENILVDTVAERCGTISYDLLCSITARVPFFIASYE
jgi:alanine racemase